VAWSNPAGLGFLAPGIHAAGALHALKPSFKYHDTGSTGAFALPGASDGGDGGDWAFVPNGFFKMNINPQLSFGVALNVPFGLKTDYDQGWRGNFTALKSEIKTININPSLAYKITDKVSVGAGFSAQKLDAELTAFSGAALGNSKLEADDWGWGFNVGMMFQAAPNVRVGATYRSSIKYDLDGSASFSGPAGGAAGSSIRADLRVPESASVSFLMSVTPQWD
jgi:long-chain fatty acid transport protein